MKPLDRIDDRSGDTSGQSGVQSATSTKGVLFLCSANSARSVMAAAFFRREAGDHFEVFSAGLDPKPIHPLTVTVMREVGIDLEGHQPHAVADYLGRRSFAYVVSVCKAAEDACPILWPFTLQHLTWPFEDPASRNGSEEEQLELFRRIRDEIEAVVLEWVRSITTPI